MTAYDKGYHFELRVQGYLEKLGWDVMRSGGSHGPADLIALGPGKVLLVQCQVGKYFSKGKKEALVALATRNGCQCGFVYRVGNKMLFSESIEECKRENS